MRGLSEAHTDTIVFWQPITSNLDHHKKTEKGTEVVVVYKYTDHKALGNVYQLS